MNTTGYYMTHNRFLNSTLNMNIHETPTSSNISRVAYDADNANLYIEFRSGKTYRYSDVSPDTWNQLIEATSTGTFFSQRIRTAYKGVEVPKIPTA